MEDTGLRSRWMLEGVSHGNSLSKEGALAYQLRQHVALPEDSRLVLRRKPFHDYCMLLMHGV